MEQITHSFKQFIGDPHIKTFLGMICALMAYTFNLGNPEMWLIIGIMVVMDTATGVIAAWKKGEAIKSSKMFQFATKVFVYGIVVALINMMARTCTLATSECPAGIAIALRIAAFSWIIATEAKSINENFAILGYTLPEKIEKILNGFTKK